MLASLAFVLAERARSFSGAVLLQELFVQHLALSSFNNGCGKETNSLSYSDLAKTAEESETFHFLTGETVNKVCLKNKT